MYILFFVLLVLTTPSSAEGETTFLANFNNAHLPGREKFKPDYFIGNSIIISPFSTSPNESAALPVLTTPFLNLHDPVSSGGAFLDIHGERDGVAYLGLSSGNINRIEGTAEGFFKTPYMLSGNREFLTFLSSSVGFTDGRRWFWELRLDGTNQFILEMGDNRGGGGGRRSILMKSLPFGLTDWKANRWHHLALTWKINPDNATYVVQLFAGGRLVGRETHADLPFIQGIESPSDNRIYIGMRSEGRGPLNGGSGFNLKGGVDSVRFDNSALYDGDSHSIGDQVFTPPAVEMWRRYQIFNPNMIWLPTGGDPVVSRKFDHRTNGNQFSCDFAKVSDRCYWETPVKMDISKGKSLSLFAYVSDAASISDITIYFKSGNGWYDWWAGNLNEGWNHLRINLNPSLLSAREGNPNGLNQIDLLRVSVWKKTDPDNRGYPFVTLYDLESGWQTADEWPFAYPEYDLKPLPIRLNRRDPSTHTLLESRAIFDEVPAYLSEGASPLLDKIFRAGFNVYVPVVWHGRGAIYRSPQGTPVDRRYAGQFRKERDPFSDLIEQAHARHIQVHGWFTVALRQDSALFPQYVGGGTPPEAFDLQNPAFRDFIVSEMIEFGRKYDVDGINLDYIRTIGYSTSPVASNLYFQRYGVDLTSDINHFQTDPAARQRFLEWQRDAVSDIVSRVSAGIKAVKPWIIISVDGYPMPKPNLNDQGRNEWLWIDNNWVDLVYSMQYERPTNFSQVTQVRQRSKYPDRFGMLLSDWDPVTDTSREAGMVGRQVDYFLKKFPEPGIGLYLYSFLTEEQILMLRKGPFIENALPYWPSQYISGSNYPKN